MDEKRLREIEVLAEFDFWGEKRWQELMTEVRRLCGMVDGLLEGDPMNWGGPCYLCHRSNEHAADCVWPQTEQARDWEVSDG